LGKPLRGVQGACGAFKVQGRFEGFTAPLARSRFKIGEPCEEWQVFVAPGGQKDRALWFFAVLSERSERAAKKNRQLSVLSVP
jgi:hypothetical protein